MIEELHTSGNMLKIALEAYLTACSAIADSFESGSAFSTISDVVAGELQLIDLCETTFKRAKSNIYRVRNSCPAIVPINTLPPEILARIFQLAVRSQRCSPGKDEDCIPPSTKRPEILSHVCTRWRQIATDTQGLWDHIGLIPFYPPNRLLARGHEFAVRAGQLLLELHIIAGKPKASLQDPGNDLSPFCASVAPRLSSLELVVREGVLDQHLPILKSCFANCVLGTLKQLSLKSRSSAGVFIEAEGPSFSSSRVVDIPNQRFEEVLLHVEVLHLRGVYFWWNSQAYHGLTELTLHPYVMSPPLMPIPESQLRAILAASPMLRKFNFGLGITLTEGAYSRPPPIALNELEYTSLYFMNIPERKALLRMMNPGSKLLRAEMRFNLLILPFLFDEEFSTFLVRANATVLCIKTRETGIPFPNLPDVVRLSPKLRNLTLSGYYLTNEYRAPGIGGGEHLPTGLQLNSLTLFASSVELTQLRQVTRTLRIQTLRLGDDCRVKSRPDELEYHSPHKYWSELSEIFPIVELIDREAFDEK